MDIVKNITAIRKEKGITQEVIAEALFVDTSVISNIEKGKRELKVSELEKIAKILDVDVLYLITYPYKYERIGSGKKTKVTLSIDIEDNIKADVIKLAFGERVLEIKNR
jgi:transcriptional regulator with XRE-family HTH domain